MTTDYIEYNEVWNAIMAMESAGYVLRQAYENTSDSENRYIYKRTVMVEPLELEAKHV